MNWNHELKKIMLKMGESLSDIKEISISEKELKREFFSPIKKEFFSPIKKEYKDNSATPFLAITDKYIYFSFCQVHLSSGDLYVFVVPKSIKDIDDYSSLSKAQVFHVL